MRRYDPVVQCDDLKVIPCMMKKSDGKFIEYSQFKSVLSDLYMTVANLPTSKIGCDGMLLVPVDRYNDLVELIKVFESEQA